VSRSGGGLPRWRGDGRELYFVAGTGELMAVAFPPGSQAPLGGPTRLFKLPPEVFGYAVSADGSQFLVPEPRSVGSSSIGLILNWAASLQQK